MNKQEDSKKCPSCQSDIPVKAKKCVHCKTDLRSWISRHPIITGLALIIVVPIILSGISESTTTTNSDSSETPDSNTLEQPILEILSAGTKVTEQNSVWWKYSWIFKVKNNRDRDYVVNANLEWVDAEGYVVETAQEYNLTIPAGEEKIFSGYELIDKQVAPTIEGIHVNLK